MPASTSTSESIVTITEIFDKFRDDKSRTRFTCRASITEVMSNSKWFYVNCSSCKGKLFLEMDTTPKFVCEDHGEIFEPKFMYCVNTTIADETKDATAVFFNEAMRDLLKISCRDLVVLHGYTDPKEIPPEIYKVRGKTAILQISIKNDETMIVNSARIETLSPPTSTISVSRKKQQKQQTATDSPRKYQKP